MHNDTRQAGPVPQNSTRRGSDLFSWTVFPIALFGSVALSIFMIGDGRSIESATVAGLLFGYGIVIIGERVYPYVPDWNRNHADVATDAAWAGTTIVSGALLRPAVTIVGGGIGASLSTRLGSSPWPNDWPLVAQLCLALIVIEFFQYWLHRFEHETDWLWRFHATHHSAPRLYWLNAARFHVVDISLLNIGFIVPLVALGAEPAVFALWVVTATIHGICQHANMQIRCGPLNWIFSMAELHRWHHSPLVQESNTNYGQNLILWDIVFGTRFLPTDHEPPKDVGIPDLPGFPMTWGAQLLSPWQWDRVKSASTPSVGPK
ncbi:MAG: sterol desaturase family protein [Myxococcales bacterium]|nr:sterol desaturase family protein [Myxococcales bacterium]HIK84100.1 sterol desaturase family protein [Myxococcales bacterium]